MYMHTYTGISIFLIQVQWQKNKDETLELFIYLFLSINWSTSKTCTSSRSLTMVFSICVWKFTVLHSGCKSVYWTRSSVWAQLIGFFSSQTMGLTYCNTIVQWQAKNVSSRREILPSVWNLLYKDMQNVGLCFVIS